MSITKRSSPTPKARKSSAAPAVPTWTPEQRGRIAELAYFRFLARGGEGGSEADDWLQAEAEFAAEAAPKRRTRTKVVPIAV